MEITINQNDDAVRISVKGSIDEQGAEKLKASFKSLNLKKISQAVFDFAGVDYIGSAGIGKLLLFYKDIALTGGTIHIENTSPVVYELLTVVKLDTIFTIKRI